MTTSADQLSVGSVQSELKDIDKRNEQAVIAFLSGLVLRLRWITFI